MQQPLTFARFVPTAQNRTAVLAAREVAVCLGFHRLRRLRSPLFLHGPPGTGKTHLVTALLEEATGRRPDLVVALLAASDLNPAARPDASEGREPLRDARASDLLVVEDLQHLPPQVANPLAALLDRRRARQQPVVLTASTGPAQLSHRGERFPARLVSRLVSGLVLGLEPLDAAGRLAVLEAQARERRLTLGPEVLTWLAGHLSGGVRQLEGALTRLEALARVHPGPLNAVTVAAHFREQAEAGRVTVERITQRVSGYFRVRADQLQSARRHRNILVPRQIGMYLARQLTGLSLEQIGAYFGGRDHSTVLHACRKVEQALTTDAVLSGAVRQLHAELA